jgi:hypothetical protein
MILNELEKSERNADEQKRNASPFQAYPEYSVNSFVLYGVEDKWVQPKSKRSKFNAIDTETGEEIPLMTAPHNKNVRHDSTKYTKLLANTTVDALPPNGKLILMYIAYHLKVHQTAIELNMREVTRWTGIGKTSFYEGIRDLLDKDIIRFKSKRRSEYLVNPNILYNGDRTKYKGKIEVKNNQSNILSFGRNRNHSDSI